mgnify:CR=1 FL=1
MYFDLGSIVFEVELIAAQSLFLYACPKRKMFWLRFLISFIACVVLAYFFPKYETRIGYIFLMLRSFAVLAYSIGLTCICYDLKFHAAISICVAGYAVQHIAYQSAFLISKIPGAEVLNGSLFGFIMYRELITMPIVFFFAWLLGGRKAAESRYFLDSDIRFDMISIFTICVCIVMTRISYRFCGFDSVPPRIFLIMCCALALIIQFALSSILTERADREVVERIRKEEKKQYELSKKMIDTINIKCHDLKFRYGDDKILPDEKKEVKEAVDIYDGMTRSGNDVLDVILTENFLCCFSQGIKFTFMGSGDYVSFLTKSDIYSLFGNALENAREAVAGLNDDKKIISLTLSKKGQFVSVDVSNYFDGNISLNDGCVVTKKETDKDFHGYGLKSIKTIAEKYGGDMRISFDNGVFNLGVFLIDNSKQK